MENILLTKRASLRKDDQLLEILINIGVPYSSNVFSHSKIEFQTVDKYDTIVKGLDDMHCIECAIYYVNGILRNSVDPEFFHDSGESMTFSKIG